MGFSRRPPTGVPEGALWLGGPVDRFRITLRIYGEELDPRRITELMGCAPTAEERKGVPMGGPGGRVPTKGRWSLTVESRECDGRHEVEDGIRLLLGRLPADLELWASLTGMHEVSVSCKLFPTPQNKEVRLAAEVSKMLADRKIAIVFEIYFDGQVVDTGNPDKPRIR